jgi:hypothetical protein
MYVVCWKEVQRRIGCRTRMINRVTASKVDVDAR